MSNWRRLLPPAPDTPCACVELARKDAIAQVRADLTDAITGDGLTVDSWRRLAAKVVVRLKGL